MYEIGAKVVYGTTGVCEVVNITTPNLPGIDEDAKYYELKPLFQNGTIFAPVENCKVFIRPVISKIEAEHLIKKIPEMKAEAYYNSKLQQLSEHYQNSLQTHHCEDLIELTKSIYAKKIAAKKNNSKLGSVDERYMKRAEELLFGELATALEIEFQQVKQYIEDTIGTLID